MKYNIFLLSAIVLCTGILPMQGCIKSYDDVVIAGNQSGVEKYPVDWAAVADSSSTSLTLNFWNAAGKYFNQNSAGNATFHYWPQAHALDVLVDAYTRSNKAQYRTYMDDWMTGVKQKNGNSFINEFYDDMEWNGIAMLRAYNATNDAKFKTGVDQVWADIKGGWNTTMGGGIAWRKAMPGYKNTPANAPAAILAARLYQKFNQASDLEWAQKIYNWLKDSLYEAGTGFVFDGINNNGDGLRSNWKFTYNHGVFIGAALELYNITRDVVYLNDAMKVANFTLADNTLTNASDRLLKDEGGGDGGLFKGIFVRYFTALILHPDLPEAYRNRYLAYLRNNIDWLWFGGTKKPAVLFGSYWKNKPTGDVDLTVQLSGAMLMESAALLKKNNLF